ncbi:MAG: GDP-mannose 4,6-dehydratase [Elusimicrobia bacterium]|nr:GDP-mannose 4,6-dehydratase [Elusimicrobiota bacterium]
MRRLPVSAAGTPRALVIGGAGFIGANSAAHLLGRGWAVSVLDDLSRKGAERNLRWLRSVGLSDFTRLDIRDAGALSRWAERRRKGLKLVLHFAAQVAVTTSVEDPRTDFEVNAWGALNVLEAARRLKEKPLTLFASTNKVYGAMEHVRVVLKGGRYCYVGRPRGVSEAEPLDFHSPYGCSKGAADQYFRDYRRIYGLPTVVFRQSCIYGQHQHGNEDQGWVAHFMKAAQAGRGVTLYGDGRQIRDVLHIDDLLAAFDAALARRSSCAGQVYNIGGGPKNTLSLLDLISWIERRQGRRVRLKRSGWRPGDQRVYVSDIRKAKRELGWEPKIGAADGLERLWAWLRARTLRALKENP